MKKLITFISIFTIMFLFNSVQAEEIQTIEAAYQDYIPVKNLTTYEGCSDTSCPISADPSKLYYYQDFNKFMKTSKNKEIFNNLYQEILKYYKEYFLYIVIFPFFYILIILLTRWWLNCERNAFTFPFLNIR